MTFRLILPPHGAHRHLQTQSQTHSDATFTTEMKEWNFRHTSTLKCIHVTFKWKISKNKATEIYPRLLYLTKFAVQPLLFATQNHERCFYGEVFGGCAQFAHTTPCDTTSDVTQKTHCAHEYDNGPEHRSNTGDKFLIGYVQQLKHIRTQYILKSRAIHQGFREFEKPFNDPSQDID